MAAMAAMSAMALSASAFTTCDRVKPGKVLFIFIIRVSVYSSHVMKDRNNSTSSYSSCPGCNNPKLGSWENG